jgi:hypothetical protein
MKKNKGRGKETKKAGKKIKVEDSVSLLDQSDMLEKFKH